MDQEECMRRSQAVRRYPNVYKKENHPSPREFFPTEFDGKNRELKKKKKLFFIFLDIHQQKIESTNQHVPRQSVRIAVYLMSGVFLSMEIEHNTTVQQIQSIIQSEPEIGLTKLSPINGQTIFSLWMCSVQLELQLRPNHRPIDIANKWNNLINKYGLNINNNDDDEPILYMKRNVFLSRNDEEQIKDPKVLELLYAEAKQNVLEGKFNICFFAQLKTIEN